MRARGFTLVEVMVALAIVAIALPALLMALYQQVDDTAYLRDKTLAEMVAANQLAQMRLVIASTRSLTTGKDNGVATLADRDWYWWAETKTTEVPQYYRIEIAVSLEEEQGAQPLYTLSAFMSGDLAIDPSGFGSGSDTGESTDTDGGIAPDPGGVDTTDNNANGGIDTGAQPGVDPLTGQPLGLPTDGQ
ncbi:MAG: type II secretion system minor pseudopilin GspI [Halioglobus sp.]